MKEIIMLVAAGIIGIATFFLLVKKMGSDCIP